MPRSACSAPAAGGTLGAGALVGAPRSCPPQSAHRAWATWRAGEAPSHSRALTPWAHRCRRRSRARAPWLGSRAAAVVRLVELQDAGYRYLVRVGFLSHSVLAVLLSVFVWWSRRDVVSRNVCLQEPEACVLPRMSSSGCDFHAPR